MPKYAAVDLSTPANVLGFYDTDDHTYGNLPPHLVALNQADWDLRLTGYSWQIVGGRLTATPASLDVRVIIELTSRSSAGIAVTSAANPGINATYSLDVTTLNQIGSVARDFGGGLGLPDGLGTFTYPDIDGQPHAFTGPQLIALYKAMRDRTAALQTQAAVMSHGGPPFWPTTDPVALD